MERTPADNNNKLLSNYPNATWTRTTEEMESQKTQTLANNNNNNNVRGTQDTTPDLQAPKAQTTTHKLEMLLTATQVVEQAHPIARVTREEGVAPSGIQEPVRPKLTRPWETNMTPTQSPAMMTQDQTMNTPPRMPMLRSPWMPGHAPQMLPRPSYNHLPMFGDLWRQAHCSANAGLHSGPQLHTGLPHWQNPLRTSIFATNPRPEAIGANTTSTCQNQCHQEPLLRINKERDWFKYSTKFPCVAMTLFDPETGSVTFVNPRSLQHSLDTGTQGSIASPSPWSAHAIQLYHPHTSPEKKTKRGRFS